MSSELTRYRVRSFSPDDLPGMASDWTSLVEISRADPLFMGWEWVSSWWDVFGRSSPADWAGIMAEDASGAIVGVCPLFLRTSRLKGVLPITRLEAPGEFWHGPPSVLTQYSQFLGDFTSKPGLMGAVADYLDRQKSWSEMVFPFLPRGGQSHVALESEAVRRGWKVRAIPISPSWIVRLDNGFDEFIRSLGPKTRRRLFNQRSRLEAMGRVEFRHVDWEERDRVVRLMNSFRHKHRVGEELSPEAMEFYDLVAARLRSRGKLRLSCIFLDGSPISVNYALRVGDREYGVQMGYDRQLEHRLSIGLLHLGYVLEAAFADNIRSYDLMTEMGGGPGWKESIANHRVDLISLQLVRNRPLAWLYGVYDRQGRRVQRLPPPATRPNG